eukprot:gene775-2531_t
MAADRSSTVLSPVPERIAGLWTQDIMLVGDLAESTLLAPSICISPYAHGAYVTLGEILHWAWARAAREWAVDRAHSSGKFKSPLVSLGRVYHKYDLPTKSGGLPLRIHLITAALLQELRVNHRLNNLLMGRREGNTIWNQMKITIDDETALRNVAELAVEIVVFSVAAGILTYEYLRSHKSERKKAAALEERLELRQETVLSLLMQQMPPILLPPEAKKGATLDPALLATSASDAATVKELIDMHQEME